MSDAKSFPYTVQLVRIVECLLDLSPLVLIPDLYKVDLSPALCELKRALVEEHGR